MRRMETETARKGEYAAQSQYNFCHSENTEEFEIQSKLNIL